jgi:hypothetical protein
MTNPACKNQVKSAAFTCQQSAKNSASGFGHGSERARAPCSAFVRISGEIGQRPLLEFTEFRRMKDFHASFAPDTIVLIVNRRCRPNDRATKPSLRRPYFSAPRIEERSLRTFSSETVDPALPQLLRT